MSLSTDANLDPAFVTDVLLEEAGLMTIKSTLIAGTVGVVVQALIAGNVVPKLHRYFVNHKNDPGLARAGVVWMGALLVAHVGVANYINIRVITMSNQFTAGYMMDFWLSQLSNLISVLILIPVFLFFAFRAWNLWSRRKLILFSLLLNIAPVIGFGLYAAIKGLQHPYPLRSLTNADFEAWLPFFRGTTKEIEWVAFASAASQLSAAASLSAMICVGLFLHRECCVIMPGFAGKVNFAFGESLLPIVLATGLLMVGELLTRWFSSPVGPLITRATRAAAPAIYLHCLLTSLTSPQRHREAVRRDFENAPIEDENEKSAGKYDTDTLGDSEHVNPWAMNVNVPSLPKIMTHRPSLTLKNPFKSASATNSTSADEVKGKSRETSTSPTSSTRRSSLANLAEMTTERLSGLSIKIHNKLPLPIVTYRPAQMDRRESESIFEAHEEFEGLPEHTELQQRERAMSPIKIINNLNAIPEDTSSDGETPGFHTPRATTPVPRSPKSGPTTPFESTSTSSASTPPKSPSGYEFDSPFSPRSQFGNEFRS